MPDIRGGAALTSWGNSWLRSGASFDAAADAIRRAGVGVVRGLADHPDPAPVGWALSALRAGGGRPLRLVLPISGDIRGVPPVTGLAAAAIAAGQLVVGAGLALLPDPQSAADGGWLAWDVGETTSGYAAPGAQLSTAAAAGALRLAVLEASETLLRLDVARWHPKADSLHSRQRSIVLPPDHEPAAAALAAKAHQLAAILEVARADGSGGAVSAAPARQRDGTLNTLAVSVREALMVAYSAAGALRGVES